jgi:hypothetical protein
MQDGVATEAAVDLGKKAISTSSLIAHIVERRIEYLVGTLIAYQIGLLDQLVATGHQCIA